MITHPSLEVNPRLVPAVRHALPTFEGNEMFAFLRDGKASAEQSQLDVLVSRSFDRLDSHPYRALGLVPARSGSRSRSRPIPSCTEAGSTRS